MVSPLRVPVPAPAPAPAPARVRLTLTDVLRAAPLGCIAGLPLSPHEKAVLFKLAHCGTGELGFYVLTCAECGSEAYTPRGCGNRHCPSCKPGLAQDWIARRQAELLPTHYYQVVFALPPQLRVLALENRKEVYGLFMDAVRDTLLAFSRDPTWLGAEPALMTVLHTWNSRLGFHLHVHALLSAGGYVEKTGTWVASPHEDFFAPVRAVGKVVRGKFMEGLQALYDGGRLTFVSGDNAPLTHPGIWKDLVDRVYAERWLVYAERPKGGPAQVIRYLGQYVQRSAMANYRIQKLTRTHVWVKHNVRNKAAPKTASGGYATSPIVQKYTIGEFLLVWARHILPRGLHRARASGLLAHSKHDALQKAQVAAARAVASPPPVPVAVEGPLHAPTLCPHCEEGHLAVTEVEIRSPSWGAFLSRAPRLPIPRAAGSPLCRVRPS